MRPPQRDRNQLPRLDHEGVGRRIEALRLALGIDKKGDFARSIGLDASTYSKIVKGERVLGIEYGFAISELYQVSLEFIYAGSLRDLPDDLRTKVLHNLGGHIR